MNPDYSLQRMHLVIEFLHFLKCCLNRGVSGKIYVRQVMYGEDRLLMVQAEDTDELKLLHLKLPVESLHMEIYAALDKAELRNPVAGNRVLEVLVEHGKKTEALELFEEMLGVCDSETVDIMFKSFTEKTLPLGLVRRRTCYRTMIKRLCEQGGGNMSEVEKLFAEMFSDVEGDELMAGPDVSTFRAMINGYVKVGRVDDAFKMLDKMKISTLRKLVIHRAT